MAAVVVAGIVRCLPCRITLSLGKNRAERLALD
jgi:hypothetical protein